MTTVRTPVGASDVPARAEEPRTFQPSELGVNTAPSRKTLELIERVEADAAEAERAFANFSLRSNST